MRILLDTHVLLWWLADDRRLTDVHRALISDGANAVHVSAISVAQIAIKASLGKLEAPDDLLATLDSGGFGHLPFDAAHADELRTLPWHHRNPFDRMLIAQARVERLTLVSVDPHFARYEVAGG